MLFITIKSIIDVFAQFLYVPRVRRHGGLLLWHEFNELHVLNDHGHANENYV